MESPFQLFRLPQLAIAEILNLLNVKEQIIFALSSSKAEKLFKFLRNKKLNPELVIEQRYWIGIEVHDNPNNQFSEPLIHVCSTSKTPHGKVERVKMGNKIIDMWIEKLYEPFFLSTYWEDQEIGIKFISDYICSLFGVGLLMLLLPGRHQKMIDMFQGASIEIISAYESCDKITEDDLRYILTNAKSKYLFICTWFQHFQLYGNHQHRFNSLLVRNGYWVTIEYLMNLDCIEIRMKERWFSNEELNRFLMHWINGGNARLKCFVVDIKDFNQQMALKDIGIQETEKNKRIYKSLSTDLEFENLEIRRNDGVVASINYSMNDGFFSFAVWPDCADTLHRSNIVEAISTL